MLPTTLLPDPQNQGSLSRPFSLSLAHTLFLSHTLSVARSLSVCLSLSRSLSLSLKHTHTHARARTRAHSLSRSLSLSLSNTHTHLGGGLVLPEHRGEFFDARIRRIVLLLEGLLFSTLSTMKSKLCSSFRVLGLSFWVKCLVISGLCPSSASRSTPLMRVSDESYCCLRA